MAAEEALAKQKQIEQQQFDEIFVLMLNIDKSQFKTEIAKNPSLLKVKNLFGMTLLSFAQRNGDLESISIINEIEAKLRNVEDKQKLASPLIDSSSPILNRHPSESPKPEAENTVDTPRNRSWSI